MVPYITIRGVPAMQRRLARLAKDFPAAFGQAMREEAEIEMTEAKARTPVDTGALRASGHVEGPFITRRNVEVRMVFGGPAAPYAIPVHENLFVFHRVGQAKYLESVLVESAPHLAERIVKRAEAIVGS